VEFKAFLDHMRELPDIEAIARGESIELPPGLDLQYGVAQALVRRATRVGDSASAEKILGNILRYARVFPQRELGVMLVTDLHRSIGRPLYAVPEFKDWAQSVSELLLYDRG
jgi:hypothetical protein